MLALDKSFTTLGIALKAGFTNSSFVSITKDGSGFVVIDSTAISVETTNSSFVSITEDENKGSC